jgi:hypothetical protein
MSVEEFDALSRRRHGPQQGAERPAVHHAETIVRLRLKCQRVDVIPPDGWFAGWHWSVFDVALRQLGGLAFQQEGRRSIDSLHDPMARGDR